MTINGGKIEQKARREARLSAALRENLKRRKAQARGRVAPADAAPTASGTAGREPGAPDFRRNQGRD